ncbi:MAG: hypothetical protein FWD70_00395 [Desulfuromonadales bacterium]|nr:hypothetical protein [Desulfuromonadales bacterium]
MKEKSISNQTILNAVAFTILLIGLAISVIIYLKAGNTPDSLIPTIDETKKGIHDMEEIGGTLNLLMYQFLAWFKKLWQGQNLAYTVAFITVVISAIIFWVAYQSEDTSPDD